MAVSTMDLTGVPSVKLEAGADDSSTTSNKRKRNPSRVQQESEASERLLQGVFRADKEVAKVLGKGQRGSEGAITVDDSASDSGNDSDGRSPAAKKPGQRPSCSAPAATTAAAATTSAKPDGERPVSRAEQAEAARGSKSGERGNWRMQQGAAHMLDGMRKLSEESTKENHRQQELNRAHMMAITDKLVGAITFSTEKMASAVASLQVAGYGGPGMMAGYGGFGNMQRGMGMGLGGAQTPAGMGGSSRGMQTPGMHFNSGLGGDGGAVGDGGGVGLGRAPGTAGSAGAGSAGAGGNGGQANSGGHTRQQAAADACMDMS